MPSELKYPVVPQRLASAEALKSLSRFSSLRWLTFVVLEWAIIAGTVAAALHWRAVWVWGFAILVIGTRQHALSILGHEGVHHMVARSRRVNDLLANYLTCYPLLLTVQGYRASHFKHHWYLETPQDPSKITVDLHTRDWTFPMPGARLATMLLRDLSGFSQASSASLLKYLWEIPHRGAHLAQIVALHTLGVAAAWASGAPEAYLLLWLVPLFTVAVACYRVRGIAEHSGFGDPAVRYRREVIDALICTRTTLLSPPIAAIFAPYNVSFHIEHHMCPAVPAFNLRRLHELVASHADYQKHAHLTRGYVQLAAELTGRRASERAVPSSATRASTLSGRAQDR